MIHAQLFIASCPQMLPTGGLEAALTIGPKKIYGRFFIDPKDDLTLRPGRKVTVMQQLVGQLDWCEKNRRNSLIIPDFQGSQHIEVAIS